MNTVTITEELQLIADTKKSWDEGLKISALVNRLKSFKSPVECAVAFSLNAVVGRDYGVKVCLSANGGAVKTIDTIVFKQTSVKGWVSWLPDKDIIAAAIMSIASVNRVSREWIPFMRNTTNDDLAKLNHSMPAGHHDGSEGIQDMRWSGATEPVKVDGAWERYYISLGNNMVYFMFPPTGWSCELSTMAELKGRQRAIEKAEAANRLAEMQKFIGWIIQSISESEVVFISPCGKFTHTLHTPSDECDDDECDDDECDD